MLKLVVPAPKGGAALEVRVTYLSKRGWRKVLIKFCELMIIFTVDKC